jgi:hypothetical protein
LKCLSTFSENISKKPIFSYFLLPLHRQSAHQGAEDRRRSRLQSSLITGRAREGAGTRRGWHAAMGAREPGGGRGPDPRNPKLSRLAAELSLGGVQAWPPSTVLPVAVPAHPRQLLPWAELPRPVRR